MDSVMKELRGGGAMPPRIFGLEPPLQPRFLDSDPGFLKDSLLTIGSQEQNMKILSEGLNSPSAFFFSVGIFCLPLATYTHRLNFFILALYKSTYLLIYLLKLRPRNHNSTLTCKSPYYDSCNFIARMLFREAY